MSKRKISTVVLALSLLLVVAGCKKKVPPPPPPPPPPPKVEALPPPPKAPSISLFTAEPSTIERGQSATLRWNASDATDASIGPGIGAVAARGSRQVFPSNTTTYTLTAKGPGGTATETATVTVTVPPPPPPPPPPPKRSLSDLLASDVQDAFFDFDKSDIREDARATLTRNADALKRIFQDLPGSTVVMEGHCDERGSAEYNLGLGDRRASAARDFLVQLGVSADRLKTISYGKERPQCTESNEDCWQKNRRAHFSAQ
jgi:peptidoglycan-associated lipoprotein